MKIKKILWPTDFSEASFKSLKYAVELAKDNSAELFIINVIHPVPLAYGGMTDAGRRFDIPHYQEELEKAHYRELSDIAENRIGKKIKTREIIAHGKEVDEIIDAADENDVDLIVISTHGYSGLKRLFFGAVAEGVVRHAKQPVLTIRITEEDE